MNLCKCGKIKGKERKDDGTGKVRKAKKRKLEKLINWGMEKEGYCVEQAE